MGYTRDVLTISRWEIRRSFGTMGKNVLPVAILLFVLLIAVTGFTAKSGLHIQDGIYLVGTDNPEIAGILSGDARYSVVLTDTGRIEADQGRYDLIIFNTTVYVQDTDRGRSALNTLQRDYAKYQTTVYNQESDLFAAYPLWIDVQDVKSELDFMATQSGEYVKAAPATGAPVPVGEIKSIPTPSPTLQFSQDQLRQELVKTSSTNSQISRYTDVLSSGSSMGSFKTPSQLSPPLPFDSIILVFVFIFPLYFTSQFFMMSIMNERIERKGEILLSTPVTTSSIIIGKMLPYFIGMVVICTGLTFYIKASPIIVLPLIPIIFFFLANALLIGMLSRSFKELSFVSIFFSTVATSYLFFPSIFANVHVISLISPLTLIVLTLQGTAWTITDYLYSTSLFWLTGAVLFYIGAKNFKEERLFSEKPFLHRIREFLAEVLSRRHANLSLFLLAGFSIPFVFMVQMMCLVLFFNLPMPYSLVLLIVFAAFIEELVKAVGIYTYFAGDPGFLTWKNLVLGCAATAIGFLVGEKLLLFITLAQITESIFGSVLFLSLGVLWMPLLLNFAGVVIVACCLKFWGRKGFVPGLVLATVIHCLYNFTIILGWIR
jgi:ABC-type Na+ efflux pump permease subunit